MPSVESVAAKIEREGEDVTLTRTLDDMSTVTATVRAFIRGYAPDEIGTSGIIQGDRRARIAPGPLALAGFPDAPRKPDLMTIVGSGQVTVVQDAETRELRGVPAVHVVQVRGG